MSFSPVSRDGFEFCLDRFFAMPGRVERVDGDVLESMFLPTQSREAKAKLRENQYFVQGQLKHYGIPVDATNLTGLGTSSLKKQLLAGKCVRVPDHIENLRRQMAHEWWSRQPPEVLASHSPSRFIKRCFLDGAGAPEPTKTPEAVVLRDVYVRRELRAALHSVAGLHFHETNRFSRDMTVFVGWSVSALEKAIRGEAESRQAAKEARRRERRERHEIYVRTSSASKWEPSLTGRYLVECEYISEGWLRDDDGDMGMCVRDTSEPGIFEASVDFGVFEGAMLVGVDESSLGGYAEAHSGNERPGDEDEDGSSDHESEGDDASGSERKAAAAHTHRGRPPPPKGSHEPARSWRPRGFSVLLRGRETGEGMIDYGAHRGSMQACGPRLVSFTGKLDIPFIGSNVAFTALKVSDDPGPQVSSWEDFSESQYEYARVARWR